MKRSNRLESIFQIFILTLSLSMCSILILSCSDDEDQLKEEGPIHLEGIWDIFPSSTHSRLDFNVKSGYAILVTDINLEGFLSSETKEYILLSDGKGVRIQAESETVPTGYFLFQDRKKEVWLGLWKEELVRLIYVKAN